MLIGRHGSIELRREWPAPTFIPASEVATTTTESRLFVTNLGWLDGQRVLVTCPAGVPLAPLPVAQLNTPIYAPCPEGYRFWGTTASAASTGPSSAHRGTIADLFWRTGITETTTRFWEDSSTVGFVTQLTAYISRDALDRFAFHTTEVGALSRDPATQFKLFPLAFGQLLIAPLPETPPATYTAALLTAATAQPLVEAEQELFPLPTDVEAVYADTSYRDWQYLGTLEGYQVETDSKMLDTSTIGDDFGDYQKNLITGAGNFNALFRRHLKDNELEGRDLLRMVYMTSTGAKARIRFSLQPDAAGINDSAIMSLAGDILIGRGSLSVDADDIIRLQTDFVVVKDVNGRGLTPAFGALD
jgi:hypothetical protein